MTKTHLFQKGMFVFKKKNACGRLWSRKQLSGLPTHMKMGLISLNNEYWPLLVFFNINYIDCLLIAHICFGPHTSKGRLLCSRMWYRTCTFWHLKEHGPPPEGGKCYPRWILQIRRESETGRKPKSPRFDWYLQCCFTSLPKVEYDPMVDTHTLV